MQDLPFNRLHEGERKVLAVERHGSDGRAISVETIAVNAGLQKNVRELAAALQISPHGESFSELVRIPCQALPWRFGWLHRCRTAKTLRQATCRRSPSLMPDSTQEAIQQGGEARTRRRARLIAD